MSEKIALYSATPGLYWSESTIDSFAAADNRWEKVDFENDNVEEIDRIAQYVSSFGIVTGYHNEDMERCSFMFNIIHGDYKVTEDFGGDDDGSIRPSISQMHYLLSYKDKIDIIVKRYRELFSDLPVWGITADEIKEGKEINFTVWTTTNVNEGDEGKDNGIVWLMDITHESSRIDFTNGEYYQLSVINADDYGRGEPQDYHTQAYAKNVGGVYYTEYHPNEVDTLFYPLKKNMTFSATPKYLVFNLSDGSDKRKPFFIEFEKKNEMEHGTWDKDKKKLTKYQWEFFLAHKDLIDEVYVHLNRNKDVGSLDTYSIPDLVWTSTDYTPKENTLGYYEVNNNKGKGIKWVVCPSLRNSQKVFKKGSECYYPKVDVWE